jgi:hypothetical protein
LAVLNTIPGECAQWVCRTGTGLSYTAGDLEGACQALTELIGDAGRLASCGQAARQASVKRWDRRKLYRPYVDLVEELAAQSR